MPDSLSSRERRFVVRQDLRDTGADDLSRVEVVIESQGHLFKSSVLRCPDMVGGGKRGLVDGFSRASRKRLLEMMARLEFVPGKTSFVTLTYPRCFPDGPTVKAHLTAFLKRVERRFGRFACIWRLDLQKRGAPHFHLLLFGAPFIPKEWVQEAWGQVIGYDRPFTRIEAIRSWRGVMSYTAHYIAKEAAGVQRVPTTFFVCEVPDVGDSGSAPGGFNNNAYSAGCPGSVFRWGRWWGVWKRDLLPFADRVSVRLPLGRWFYDVKAWGRRVYPVNLARYRGFSLFRSDPGAWFSACTMMYAQQVGGWSVS